MYFPQVPTNIDLSSDAEPNAELHHGSTNPEPPYNSSSDSESPGDHTASTSSESGSDIDDEDFEVKQHQLAE